MLLKAPCKLLDILNFAELIEAMGAFQTKSPFSKRDSPTKTFSITGSAASDNGDEVLSARLELIEIQKTNGIDSKEKLDRVKNAPKANCKLFT